MDASALLTLVLALQGVSLIVLALFAPFAIGILISYFTGTKPKIKALEQRVLLNQVLSKKPFGLALLALILLPFFAPLLFGDFGVGVISFEIWDLPTISFAFWGLPAIPLFMWGYAILYFLKVLNKLYNWLSDKGQIVETYFRKPIRIPSERNWFKNRVSVREKLDAWNDIWGMNLQKESYFVSAEKKLFSYFSADVDSSLEAEDDVDGSHMLAELFEGFSNTTDNLNIWPFLAFPKILEWHYKFWKRYDLNNLDNLKDGIVLPVTNAEGFLGHMMQQSIKNAFTRDSLAWYHFDRLKTHLEKHGEESNGNVLYVNEFLSIFRLLLDLTAESGNTNFPNEWKCTISNYEEYFHNRVFVSELLEWFGARIQDAHNLKHDTALDRVSRELFPEVDPIIWARILTFIFRGYEPGKQVESIIDRPPNFGLFGRVRFMSGDAEDFANQQQQAEFDKTIELVNYFFNKYIAENMQEWEGELKSLPDSEKKEYWREIFAALRAEAAKSDEQADSSAEQTD